MNADAVWWRIRAMKIAFWKQSRDNGLFHPRDFRLPLEHEDHEE